MKPVICSVCGASVVGGMPTCGDDCSGREALMPKICPVCRGTSHSPDCPVAPHAQARPTIPDYSNEEPPAITVDVMQNFGRLVAKQGFLEMEIEDLEEKLAAKKKMHREYQENILPQAMREIGLDEIRTNAGIHVVIKRDFQASLPESEERRSAAFAYIRSTGNENLITSEIVVKLDKGTASYGEDIFSTLTEYRLEDGTPLRDQARITRREDINHQTMLKFIRDESREGKNIPLKDFGAFPTTKAVIKRKASDK